MRDMIVFGEDWGRHPSSTQHLVKRLAQDAKIIWVNSLGLRRPRFNLADLGRLASKAQSFTGGATAVEADPQSHTPCIATVNPATIPFPGSRIAASLNRRILRRQLGPVMRSCGMLRPLLWTSLPTALPVVGALAEHALVYYAGDDFGALAGVDHKPVLEMEARLAEKADLIVAASPLIAARFPHERTRVLPHGVDYHLFAEPVVRALDLPKGKPVAGFYGSVNSWIDIEALALLAGELADWNIVLIGRIETDVTALRRFSNVHFLGTRPHGELAAYAQHWEVSLLPFRRNRQIDACNPLKLREYLAAGQPVLASHRFPAILPYADVINVPEEGETFSDAVRRARHDDAMKALRQDRVRPESWDARAAELRSWLGQL